VIISGTALGLAALLLAWGTAFVLFLVALRRRWFSRFAHGLFIAIALAVAGAALMSATVVGRWGFVAAKQSVDGEVATTLESVASVVDRQVNADLRQMQQNLERVATEVAPLVQGQRPHAWEPELLGRLAAIRALFPHYLDLRVVDLDSDLIGSEVEPLNWVAVASAKDGKRYLSDAFESRAYGRQVMTMAVPMPDPSAGVHFVLTAVFDVQAMLEELVADSRFNQSGYAVIVDGDGDVLAHLDESRIGTNLQSYVAVQRAWATRGSGSVVARNESGVDRLFFYRALKNPSTSGRQPWVLLTEVDEAEEVAVLRGLQRQLYAGIAALFVSSLILAHQIAGSIDRPLTALKQLAFRIGQGELDARSDVSGRDLAGSLAASLDSMAAGLRERERVKEVFGRYIATQVSDRILKGDVTLGGEARVVSILFSDIRNFTAMAEDMTPQQVVSFLNAYFAEMVEAVFEQGGVLDKFLGDGMMAVFGSLGDQPDHAVRAVRAALRMHETLTAHGRDSRVRVRMRVGVNTGEVLVGNIGSARRLEYTVVGDGVNTSSRVQALNKEFGTTILITETTYEAVKSSVECRPMPDTALRGKQRTLRFYEVVAAREAASV
jgi:adenylate cyclase